MCFHHLLVCHELVEKEISSLCGCAEKGSTFAKHIVCESLKNLVQSKVGKTNVIAKEHEMQLKRHNKYSKSCK